MSRLQHAWFRLALWCEARLMPLRIRDRPMAELLALADGPVLPGFRGLPARYVARRVRTTTRRPWFMTKRPCLREGILAYRFLRAAGFAPELRFGIDRDSIDEPAIRAHCWVVLGGEVILNPPEPGLVTILEHSADRLSQPAGVAA